MRALWSWARKQTGPKPKRRRRPSRPFRPEVELLEKRWLMSIFLTPLGQASAVEGQTTGSRTLASFTFDDGFLEDYRATVDWGDNTSSVALVQPNGAGGLVKGEHTYYQKGSYVVTIHVSGNDTEDNDTTPLAVNDAALTASAKTIHPLEGQPFTGVVASFTDANPFGTFHEFTATIAWGDGQSSGGTIRFNGDGGWDVLGTHTYADDLSYPVHVSIAEQGGGSAFATGTAVV